MYTSYDILCSWENYNLGVGYETLFASSLAVKYYLRSISTGKSGYISFRTIYDFSPSDSHAFQIMDQFKVNFSQGISLPTHEVFANVAADLGHAVVHNRNIHNAHHDIILPARTKQGIANIAVQAKASINLSDRKTIMNQLPVSPKRSEQVKQLFWLYIGEAS